MAQPRFNIGLDFGTYQSKACVFHTSANPQKHQFVQFPTPEGGQSYLLPSCVYLMPEGTFDYGFPPTKGHKSRFTYFKIASAEDPHFRLLSGLEECTSVYRREEFGEYSPELLSCLFLTYQLMSIKENLRTTVGTKPKTGLFGRVLSTPGDEVTFTVQLGIPTEYSRKINLMRRRKFENILLVSEMLQRSVGDTTTFRSLRANELIDRVKASISSIDSAATSVDDFNNLLDQWGVSVYPEAAAGLTFLVKTRRLEPGNYAALDIGGGSSDLSFFTVTADNRIKYLASEAFMVAANDMYRKFAEKEIPSFADMQLAESMMLDISKSSAWQTDNKFVSAVEEVSQRLYGRLHYLFNDRVYWYFDRYEATGAFKNQPCFVYGGGARLPIHDRMRSICIHNNGQPNATALHTNVVRTSIDRYLPTVGILPADDSWRTDFGLLVVAFGLSFPHSDDETYWDPSEYTTYSHRPEKAPELLAHPFNEDMFIYDVVLAKWRQD